MCRASINKLHTFLILLLYSSPTYLLFSFTHLLHSSPFHFRRPLLHSTLLLHSTPPLHSTTPLTPPLRSFNHPPSLILLQSAFSFPPSLFLISSSSTPPRHHFPPPLPHPPPPSFCSSSSSSPSCSSSTLSFSISSVFASAATKHDPQKQSRYKAVQVGICWVFKVSP